MTRRPPLAELRVAAGDAVADAVDADAADGDAGSPFSNRHIPWCIYLWLAVFLDICW